MRCGFRRFDASQPRSGPSEIVVRTNWPGHLSALEVDVCPNHQQRPYMSKISGTATSARSLELGFGNWMPFASMRSVRHPASGPCSRPPSTALTATRLSRRDSGISPQLGLRCCFRSRRLMTCTTSPKRSTTWPGSPRPERSVRSPTQSAAPTRPRLAEIRSGSIFRPW